MSPNQRGPHNKNLDALYNSMNSNCFRRSNFPKYRKLVFHLLRNPLAQFEGPDKTGFLPSFRPMAGQSVNNLVCSTRSKIVSQFIFCKKIFKSNLSTMMPTSNLSYFESTVVDGSRGVYSQEGQYWSLDWGSHQDISSS